MRPSGRVAAAMPQFSQPVLKCPIALCSRQQSRESLAISWDFESAKGNGFHRLGLERGRGAVASEGRRASLRCESSSESLTNASESALSRVPEVKTWQPACTLSSLKPLPSRPHTRSCARGTRCFHRVGGWLWRAFDTMPNPSRQPTPRRCTPPGNHAKKGYARYPQKRWSNRCAYCAGTGNGDPDGLCIHCRGTGVIEED